MSELQFLNEVLDLKTSKSYDYQITPKEDYPSSFSGNNKIIHQVTFETETGKEYAVRFFKDKSLGMHSIGVVVSLKKQSKWYQNIVLDSATFKKVIVTMFKAYDDFKDTNNGKMTSGFMVILQKSIADRAGLLVKALGKAFKTQPKKKLDLYAATDEMKGGATALFFVNPMSTYPYFKGKGFDEAWLTSPLFKSLAGETEKKTDFAAAFKSAQPIQEPKKEIFTGASNLEVDAIVYVMIKNTTKYDSNHPSVSFAPAMSIAALSHNKTENTYINMGVAELVTKNGTVLTGGSINFDSDTQFTFLTQDGYQSTRAQYTNKGDGAESDMPKFGLDHRYVTNKVNLKTIEGVEVPSGTLINLSVTAYMKALPNGYMALCVIKHKDGEVSTPTWIELPKDYLSVLQPVTSADWEKGYPKEEPKPKTVEQKIVTMLQNSGSSKLLSGDTANIIDTFTSLSSTPDLIKKYGLPDKYKNYHVGGYIVEPVKYPGKYVMLPKVDEGDMYVIGSVDVEAPTAPTATSVTKTEDYNDINPPVTNTTSVVSVFSEESISQAMKSKNLDADIELVEGVNIKLDDYSFIGLAEKLKQMSALFGSSIDKNKFKILRNRLTTRSGMVAEKIEKMLIDDGHYMKSGKSGVSAIRAYSGSDYRDINRFLRNPKKFADENSASKQTAMQDYVNNIDKAFRLYGVKLQANLPVYRGASISNKDIENLQDGKTHYMESYSSASLQTSTAYSFAKFDVGRGFTNYAQGVIDDKGHYAIDSAQGNKIFMTITGLDKILSLYIAKISQHSGEMELLMNRGTHVRCKAGQKPVLLLETTNGVKCWAANVQVTGGLNESIGSRAFASLYEEVGPAIRSALDLQAKLGLVMFYIDALLDDADEKEAETL